MHGEGRRKVSKSDLHALHTLYSVYECLTHTLSVLLFFIIRLAERPFGGLTPTTVKRPFDSKVQSDFWIKELSVRLVPPDPEIT